MRNMVKVAGAAACLLICLLCSGCWVLHDWKGSWIFRDWKDYLPITNIGLQKDVRTYEGFFFPRYSGGYALSLLIKKSSSDKTQVGLRFRGEVEFVGGGRRKVVPFDETIGEVCLPPTPFKIHIVSFQADEIERYETGRGRFVLTVEGDIAQYLEREPNSSICVSFVDSK